MAAGVLAVTVAETTSFTTVNTTPLAFLLMGVAGALAARPGDEATLEIADRRPFVIWPVIALATLWAFVRAARSWWSVRHRRG